MYLRFQENARTSANATMRNPMMGRAYAATDAILLRGYATVSGTATADRCPTVVVRRHLLAALAAGVERSDDAAARAALEPIDWILRRMARRRLERALIDAALATGIHATPDAASTRHLLQAAALIVARRDVEL